MTEGDNRTTELVDAITEIWRLIVGVNAGSAIEPVVRLFPTALVGEELLLGGKTAARGEMWLLWPDLNALSSAVPTESPDLSGAGLVSGLE